MIQRRSIVHRSHGHRECLRHRQVVTGGAEITVQTTILYNHCYDSRTTLIRNRRVLHGPCGICRCVNNHRCWNQPCITAGSRYSQRLALATTRRNATQVNRLLRRIFADGRIVQIVQRGDVINSSDGHLERLCNSQIVSRGVQFAIIASVLQCDSDNCHTTQISNRSKLQAAGRIGSCVRDGRRGNQSCIVAGNADFQRLRLPRSGRDPGQIHRLLSSIFSNRHICWLIEIRRVIHRIHGQREGSAEVAIIRCRIDITVQTRIFDRHRNRDQSMSIRCRRKLDQTGGVGRRVDRRRIRHNAGITAGSKHSQRLRFIGTCGDPGQVNRVLTGILSNRQIVKNVQCGQVIHRLHCDYKRLCGDQIVTGSPQIKVRSAVFNGQSNR